MDQPTTSPDKHKSFRADFLFACSMFFLCSICLAALIATPFWQAWREQPILSANSTSTASVLGTKAARQQANTTVTAIAHATEQAGYPFINRFDRNSYSWRQGKENNNYWSGYIAFENGVYVWDIKEVRNSFISIADFPGSEKISDFDLYVDTKVMQGEPGAVCAGLLFRRSPSDVEEDDYYSFSLCNDGVADIGYHSDADGWDQIESVSSIFAFPYSEQWNRLEVSARGSHFTFSINGTRMYEMDDERLKAGGIALSIELNEKSPARVVFDNFGLKYR